LLGLDERPVRHVALAVARAQGRRGVRALQTVTHDQDTCLTRRLVVLVPVDHRLAHLLWREALELGLVAIHREEHLHVVPPWTRRGHRYRGSCRGRARRTRSTAPTRQLPRAHRASAPPHAVIVPTRTASPSLPAMARSCGFQPDLDAGCRSRASPPSLPSPEARSCGG